MEQASNLDKVRAAVGQGKVEHSRLVQSGKGGLVVPESLLQQYSSSTNQRRLTGQHHLQRSHTQG